MRKNPVLLMAVLGCVVFSWAEHVWGLTISGKLSGAYFSSDTIISQGTCEADPGCSATCEAYHSVTLNPIFHAKPGSSFVARTSDPDGLPNIWEMTHFGTLDQGAEDDPDTDRVNNLQEYSLGSDPVVFDREDLDGDGLADLWELAWLGGLWEDGYGDDDGDGFTNAHEYALYQDPHTFDQGYPLGLLIVSPRDGEEIFKPRVMVEGVIVNVLGKETGVTANGMAANLDGYDFVVNSVPLQDGENVVTVKAVAVDGTHSEKSITILSATGDENEYVTLSTDMEAGNAPLEVVLRINATFTLAGSTLSYTGPGQAEFLSESAGEYQVRLTAEGTYFFTVEVTGPQNESYSDTIAIQVFDPADMDDFFRAKWTSLLGCLQTGDISGALNYISLRVKPAYAQMFDTLSGQLPAIIGTARQFDLVSVGHDIAEYELLTAENGKTYSYEVIFRKDPNGLWMVEEF